MNARQVSYAYIFLIDEGYVLKETVARLVIKKGMNKETIDRLVLAIAGQPDFISLLGTHYPELLDQYKKLQYSGE